MDILQALLLGIVQGLTEFLPVSSSGHLVIFPQIFGWEEQPLVFDTTLHLATALALLVYFWKDLASIAIAFKVDFNFFKFDLKKYSLDGKVGWAIVAGSIPAAILGYLFEDAFESYFRAVWTVALFLILGSVLMLIAERFSRIKTEEVNMKKGFIIGIFQALALFPGISRSGATISGGMLLGLSREKAARFSFLLSMPIVVGAGLLKVYTSAGELVMLSWEPVIVGFVASFISGMLAIGFLLRFVKTHRLYVFIVYRIVLALLLLIITL
jgi:undecaprenyl-diphosphatase